MAGNAPLVPQTTPIVLLTADSEARHSEVSVAATRDHALIRRWAAEHDAEPATGEQTASGGRTVHVNDGGAGIRFNFPALSRFRPISWDEWFDNFERHELVFVYERKTPGAGGSLRYQLVKMDALQGGPRLR
jgi:hypothetical protein